MECGGILEDLDDDQRRAALAEGNAVVSAGAGSGKTKTLASRFVSLVARGDCAVDEILTLTFTNKAANEMYSRIYRMLAERSENENCRRAVADFHKARISTLDSFCALVVRSGAHLYGVDPLFSSDDTAVRDLAREASLRFVLDRCKDEAVQALLSGRKIRDAAQDVFAEAALNHIPLSSPPDFAKMLAAQKAEALARWKEYTDLAEEIFDGVKSECDALVPNTDVFYTALTEFFSARPRLPPAPDMAADDGGGRREAVEAFFACLDALAAIRLPGGKTSVKYAQITGLLKELKNEGGVLDKLLSLANFLLQFNMSAGLFALLDEFQKSFNRQKRIAGVLSFNDIAHLAVDILREHPDIRKVFKASIKKIMIDEFQDNNALQRDLVYLLAEDEERREKGMPPKEALSAGKMFFVGDEKQSIYRFRGADVSVFRALSGDFAGESLMLTRNYRSHPALIEGFNYLFGGVKDDAGNVVVPGVFPADAGNAAGYKAVYRYASAPDNSPWPDDGGPRIHLCFLDKGRLSGGDGDPGPHDLEAVFIARTIKSLIDKGFLVSKKNADSANGKCAYGDFAVLERSYTHQAALEKQFRHFGVPYTTDMPVGLFTDAPVNDLRAFLRLLVYPEDRVSYAALLKSPFMGLSDSVLAVCMMNEEAPPFAESLEPLVPEEERGLYREARERYQRALREASLLPVTELITKLWYEEGYRFETVWSSQAQVYSELYDLFFELARDTDARGKSLADFLDYLEDLVHREEKANDMELSAEGESGVRIMSIHKSKGLEFPVVFLFDAAGAGVGRRGGELITRSERWGLSVKLPRAEELSSIERKAGGENYFQFIQKEEENLQTDAELRRLLYVAMTRAESAVYVCASLAGQSAAARKEHPDDGPWDEEAVRGRLLEQAEKTKDAAPSFLALLVPVAAAAINSGDENLPFTIEAIPALERKDLYRLYEAFGTAAGIREAAARALSLYTHADCVAASPALPLTIAASSLNTYDESAAERTARGGGDKRDALDESLERAGLGTAGFGSLVHAFLEAHLSGQPPAIPAAVLSKLPDESGGPALIRTEAERMASGFLSSNLGRLCRAAKGLRETEFPVLTLVSAGNRVIPVTGQIDLLFEASGCVHLVDFKTDRTETPEHHLGQLAAYERAVQDIFNPQKDKKVRLWLFYLRTGREVEVTDLLGKVNLEEMAERRLREAATGKVDDAEPP